MAQQLAITVLLVPSSFGISRPPSTKVTLPQIPVIPLGIHVDDFARDEAARMLREDPSFHGTLGTFEPSLFSQTLQRAGVELVADALHDGKQAAGEGLLREVPLAVPMRAEHVMGAQFRLGWRSSSGHNLALDASKRNGTWRQLCFCK
mgnify:CR=1 FL=1